MGWHCNDDNFRTGERCLNGCYPACNNKIKTAAHERLSSHRTAVNEDDVSIQVMLFKKAHFLSNPNRCIGGRKISIADDNFVALGAGSPEQHKTPRVEQSEKSI